MYGVVKNEKTTVETEQRTRFECDGQQQEISGRAARLAFNSNDASFCHQCIKLCHLLCSHTAIVL